MRKKPFQKVNVEPSKQSNILILLRDPVIDLWQILPFISSIQKDTQIYVVCMTSCYDACKYRSMIEQMYFTKFLGVKKIFQLNNINEQNSSTHGYSDQFANQNLNIYNIEKSQFFINIINIVNKQKIETLIYLNQTENLDPDSLFGIQQNYINIFLRLLAFIRQHNKHKDKTLVKKSHYKILTNRVINNNNLCNIEVQAINCESNFLSFTMQLFQFTNEFFKNTQSQISFTNYYRFLMFSSQFGIFNMLSLFIKFKLQTKMIKIRISNNLLQSEELEGDPTCNQNELDIKDKN